jgi:hypothetical protein
MPALPVINDVFRVALTWTDATGQDAVNVMHFLDFSSGHDAGDLMSALNAHVTANMWLSVVDTAVVTDVAITELDGSTATAHFAPATPAHWTGGNPVDFSPATAVVVKETTLFRGRSKRGRVFLPFTSENIISGGSLNHTTASNMTTAWDAFGTAMSGASPAWPLVVASYKLASAESVIGLLVEDVLATQRRRQSRLR